MNAQLDLKLLGWLVVGVGGMQLPPMLLAWLSGGEAYPFAASAAIALIAGLSVALSSPETDDRSLRARDGFLVVGLGWILASLFGALPYWMSGRLELVDAVFESVAGFTTTGSTVLFPIEGTPRPLLLWRSITQWLGGMGILIFAIAVLPLLGIGGMQLFRAEVTGPTADKLRPRIAETARGLLSIYLGATVVETLALALAGMGPFEAVCHGLTSAATGGFSTRDASIRSFDSPTIEWLITAFRLFGGINYALHYRLFLGDLGRVVGDTELRYFLATTLVATLVVTFLLASAGETSSPLRDAAFSVVSLVTTTGYATADFETWPPLAMILLLQLMILGGMAGSTSGGVKDLRVILGFRVLRNTIARSLHPRSVISVKYAGEPVPVDVLAGIWSFLTAYFAIAAVATAVVAFAGYDLVTAVSAALTAVGNVGPALGEVGPTDNFGHFPGYVKLTLCFCMLAGRLELFTILVLLLPGFWRR